MLSETHPLICGLPSGRGGGRLSVGDLALVGEDSILLVVVLSMGWWGLWASAWIDAGEMNVLHREGTLLGEGVVPRLGVDGTDSRDGCRLGDLRRTLGERDTGMVAGRDDALAEWWREVPTSDDPRRESDTRTCWARRRSCSLEVVALFRSTTAPTAKTKSSLVCDLLASISAARCRSLNSDSPRPLCIRFGVRDAAAAWAAM